MNLGMSHDLEAAQKLAARLEGLTMKRSAKIAELENTADNGCATS